MSARLSTTRGLWATATRRLNVRYDRCDLYNRYIGDIGPTYLSGAPNVHLSPPLPTYSGSQTNHNRPPIGQGARTQCGANNRLGAPRSHYLPELLQVRRPARRANSRWPAIPSTYGRALDAWLCHTLSHRARASARELRGEDDGPPWSRCLQWMSKLTSSCLGAPLARALSKGSSTAASNSSRMLAPRWCARRSSGRGTACCGAVRGAAAELMAAGAVGGCAQWNSGRHWMQIVME